VAQYEALEDVLGRIISYAGLVYAGDTTDPRRAKFYGDAQEKITDASSDLLFFTLELNRIDDSRLQAAIDSGPLAHYRPWIDDIRREKPYQLDDKIEQLFHEKSVTGRGAWNRLFDETMAGLRFEVDGETLTLEPALNPETALHAAIHLPQDEVGNCRQYALLLKQKAEDMGVRFAFNTTLLPLSRSQPTQLQVKGAGAVGPFDAVVVCAGMGSLPLLRPLGVNLPMIAVHGYSVTAAIRNPLDAPRSGLMDERYKVSISRLGQRIRVAGSAELGGSAQKHNPAALETLYKVLSDWFPGGAKISDNLQIWKGARPMLPDGPPILGASGVPGVWLNLGHGSSGWALASGSAKVMSDLVSDRPPDLDISGLGLDRLRA
jgi:glycine/D-amino acid oxidase-like deaminating enzyme